MKSAHLLLGVVLLTGTAFGHARLVSPTPRNTAANKTGPCGVARTASFATFAPGQTITVTWTETIDHPGHYRIAFSPAGDQGFDQNVLKDNIPNPAGAQATNSTTVTLPSTPCTDCTLQLIQVMTNTTPASNYYSCADIRLSGGNAAPTIATQAAASPATVTGTTTALSVLGADDSGEGGLSYTWAATSGPAAVAFSANGNNAAKATTATFTRAGAYTFTVTATDAAGLSATSTVSVTVSTAVGSVLVAPASASVAVAGTRQFTATAYDQFGTALATQPAATWSVSGGGTISASGLFTAGASAGGPFTVTASAGGKSGPSMVTVTAGIAPTVAQAATAASTSVSGVSVALTALGADDGGEASLSYTWSAPGAASPVTFSASGTNAAKSTTATFGAAGSYTLQVTIRDLSNLTVTSSVSVTVVQVPTSVVVSPSSATVLPGLTQAFAAVVSDQFARALAPQPSLTWSASGGGTVTSAGLFTAGGVAGGPYAVSASAGGKTGTATVSVSLGAPPTVTTPASAASSTVNATSVGLSVLAADDSGEGSLSYTWATIAGPAAVLFSANGSNAAKATSATFIRAGAYTFEVTIRDSASLTTTSTVSVTVNQALTQVAVTPSSSSVPVSGTLAFAASAADQFGVQLAPQPAFTWSVSGGGTIAPSGLFSAGAVAGGPYTVTAMSGGKSGTASLTVTAADAPTVVQAAAATLAGKTATLTVLGADDGGEAALRYSWRVLASPAAVSFSANGTNAAKQTTATFAAPGLYRLEVSILDANGKSAVSGVEVTVEAAVARLELTPAVATVAPGGTFKFSATAFDQFDQMLGTQPALSWSVSGGGSISSAGFFTAGVVAGGPFELSVRAGNVGATASVSISGTAVDRGAPRVALVAPSEGTVIDGNFTLQATAVDDVGVSRLTFLFRGREVGTLNQPPWVFGWDTVPFPDGRGELSVEATDAAGNVGRQAVMVQLHNRNGREVTAGCSAIAGGPLGALLVLVLAALRRKKGTGGLFGSLGQ